MPPSDSSVARKTYGRQNERLQPPSPLPSFEHEKQGPNVNGRGVALGAPAPTNQNKPRGNMNELESPRSLHTRKRKAENHAPANTRSHARYFGIFAAQPDSRAAFERTEGGACSQNNNTRVVVVFQDGMDTLAHVHAPTPPFSFFDVQRLYGLSIATSKHASSTSTSKPKERRTPHLLLRPCIINEYTQAKRKHAPLAVVPPLPPLPRVESEPLRRNSRRTWPPARRKAARSAALPPYPAVQAFLPCPLHFPSLPFRPFLPSSVPQDLKD